MMNNIILNGVNSNTIQGLIIQELPPISKPAIRTEIEEIDGRDGDVITKLGYAAYDKQLSIGLYGNYDINQVISFFDTSGVVTFSNEPDKYYNYQILNEIDFERLVRFRTATVTMHIQPFKYSTTETPQTLSGTVITGEGNNINLVNTTDSGLFTDLQKKGDTFQQTYSGKNLCGIPNQTITFNGVDITIQDGEITLNGTATSTGTKQLQPIKTTTLNGNYTNNVIYISGTSSSSDFANFNIRKASDGTIISGTQTNLIQNNTNIQLTVSENTSIIYGIYVRNNTTYTNYKFKPQLVTGTTADYNWEQYVGGTPSPNPDYPQEIKTITGNNNVTICNKNIYNPTTKVNGIDIYTSGCTAALNNDVLQLTATDTNMIFGTGRAVGGNYYYDRGFLMNIKPSTKYTFSIDNSIVNRAYFNSYDENKKSLGGSNVYGTTGTYTTPSNAKYMTAAIVCSNAVIGTTYNIKVQIEVGDTATEYETYTSQTYPISLGNIELCSTNGTEDYIYKNNGTWYKHSVIGKVILDGINNVFSSKSSTTNNNVFVTNVIDDILSPSSNNNEIPGYSNYFSSTSANDVYSNNKYGFGVRTDKKINFGFTLSSSINTKELANSWLSTHNTELYYPLATPTDTEITDSTLLSQLNALGNATTYLGATNISTSGDGLSPILYVETVAVDDPTLKITNSGNTTAKPIMTLYGTGTINLSLNGEQIFVIDLSSENYITIDVANMEAYYNGILKNRLVTGNYENFVLNQGENEITFTGTLYSLTISNYSRWI